MAVKLTWNGDHIRDRVLTAARQGIDETTAAAVVSAKRNHPGWRNQSGLAEGSIQMRPATIQGNRVSGVWGSFQVAYFLWLEIGARGRPGDNTLRRAAQHEYPALGQRIQRRLR